MPRRITLTSGKRRPAADRFSGRAKIVQAAREHFFRHGFHNVTMDEVAAELGLSKKTLYRYFPAKDALLEAVLNNKFQQVRARLVSISRGAKTDFKTRLQAMLTGLETELAELQPPFVHDMRRNAPHIFARLEKRRQRLIEEHFGKLFRDGQRSGDVRRELPVELMIAALLAAVHAIMNPVTIEKLRLPPRQAFSAVLELMLHGALQRKGAGR